MQRWVGLGVISDNLVNIGRVMAIAFHANIPCRAGGQIGDLARFPARCSAASMVAPKCQQRRQPIAVCSITCWRCRA